MAESMNIMLAGTKDYVLHMFETLFSVKQFTSRHVDAHIMIDTKRIDLCQFFFDKNKIKDVDVHLYDSSRLDEVLSSKLRMDFTKMTYARIVLMDLLASSCDKALWLDADVWQVKHGIEELYDTDISDYYAAGVEDISVKHFNKVEIDKCKTDLYINAGVILVNLKKSQEDGILSKMMKCLHKPLSFLVDPSISTQYDQPIINYYISGKVKAVDPKFNMQRHTMCLQHNEDFAKQWGYADEDDMVKNAVFAHAVGAKPWQQEYSTWQSFQHKKCLWQSLYWSYISSLVRTSYSVIDKDAFIVNLG